MSDTKQEQPLKILLVEDEPADAALVGALLGNASGQRGQFDIHHVEDMDSAERYVGHHDQTPNTVPEVDCILLDLNLPRSEGVKNVRRLRTLRPDVTIVVMTSTAAESVAVHALELGAQDFIYKGDLTSPGVARVISHAITRDRAVQALEAERREAYELARRDQLTALLNRQGFEEHCARYFSLARRQGQQLAVGYMDLDKFKRVNDELGHAAGDLVLQGVATALEDGLREEDVCARLSGDEFAFVLTGLGKTGNSATPTALHVGQRILDAVSALKVPGASLINCSIGLALYPDDGQDYEQLLARADTAMYTVKRSGGSGVRRYEGDSAAVVDLSARLEAQRAE